jgi:hypothetical protein
VAGGLDLFIILDILRIVGLLVFILSSGCYVFLFFDAFRRSPAEFSNVSFVVTLVAKCSCLGWLEYGRVLCVVQMLVTFDSLRYEYRAVCGIAEKNVRKFVNFQMRMNYSAS